MISPFSPTFTLLLPDSSLFARSWLRTLLRNADERVEDMDSRSLVDSPVSTPITFLKLPGEFSRLSTAFE